MPQKATLGAVQGALSKLLVSVLHMCQASIPVRGYRDVPQVTPRSKLRLASGAKQLSAEVNREPCSVSKGLLEGKKIEGIGQCADLGQHGTEPKNEEYCGQLASELISDQ